MECLACGWKSRNTHDLSFCPECGSDADLADYAIDNLVTCDACDATYLYWQDADHKNFACG